MTFKKPLLGIMVILFLFSCGAKFTCPAPGEGITCTPVNKVLETYQRGIKKTSEEPQEQHPAQQKQLKPREKVEKPVYDNVPIRIPPKIVRVWITPYEDEDGDLNQGTYIYTEILEGRWVIGEKPEKPDVSEFKRFKQVYPAAKRPVELESTAIEQLKTDPEKIPAASEQPKKEDCPDGVCSIEKSNTD